LLLDKQAELSQGAAAGRQMPNEASTQGYVIWIVAVIGAGALRGVFLKMKPDSGFGPFNLRAVGIVVVATFATLLAVSSPAALSAGIGILGALAGYLFGIKGGSKENKPGQGGTPPKGP
jgi:hypothetical protein